MEGRENYRLSLTDTFVPELSEGLVGAAPGEHRDITAKLSDNFPITELQGKEMLFACDVKQVLEKRVPEVTEDLFKGVMPNKSLDEVREAVRQNMKASRERSNEASKADQIADKLADQLDFPLPDSLVESEAENVLQRKIYAAMQDGDFDASKDSDSLRDEARKEAVRSLRVYFVLQEIAVKENVSVSDYELTDEIARMAHRERVSNLKTYIRKLQKEGRLVGIRLRLVTSKVMDLLVKKAQVISTEEKSEE